MGEHRKELAEAEALALKYCNPDDSEIISDLDRHIRESAWALLERIKELEEQKCVCEQCGAEVEEEEIVEEEVAEEEVVETEESETPKEIKTEAPETSTIEKLTEIADNNKELLKKATKTVAGAGTVAATTQTAAAATPSLTTAVTTFVQEAGQKVAAIGTAGIMSIGSGAYFQAKTAGTEGMEVAVITEQQYGLFSNLNTYSEAIFGVTAFETIIEYAEKGYGDVEGTNPDAGAEGGDGGGTEGGDGGGTEGGDTTAQSPDVEGGDDTTKTETKEETKNPIDYEEVKDDPQATSVGDQ